jgi:hypothetical protein
MTSFGHRQQANRVPRWLNAIARQIPRAGWGVLLLVLAACGFDMPPRAHLLCREWGGRIEYRPLLDGTSQVTDYCVFADGTECHAAHFHYGNCTPPGASAPLSPVPMPKGAFGPPMGADFAGFAPPPSLDALVEQATLIFTGTVGPIEQYLETVGVYGADNQLALSGMDAEGTPLPGYPVTDFLLQVENVIRDDGTIAAGEPIILRVEGHVSEELKQTSQAGE